jgi:hypothetical protein
MRKSAQSGHPACNWFISHPYTLLQLPTSTLLAVIFGDIFLQYFLFHFEKKKNGDCTYCEPLERERQVFFSSRLPWQVCPNDATPHFKQLPRIVLGAFFLDSEVIYFLKVMVEMSDYYKIYTDLSSTLK